MANSGSSSSGNIFTTRTPILGQKLYVLIIATVLLVLAVFLLIFLFLRNRSSKRRRIGVKHSSGLLPVVGDEISEVKESDQRQTTKVVNDKQKGFLIGDVARGLDIESESKKGSSESKDSSTTRSESSSALSASTDGLGNFSWGRWYSLRELQIATNQFSSGNVIGEGGYGIVYRGVLHDGSVVAVKNLLNNKGQAEKEFKVEVEAIGKVKHKNLVGLIGYCAEGAQRLLVYEYIDNGNLEQWLHGDVGPVSPLTWEIRMKIAIGTARGNTSYNLDSSLGHFFIHILALTFEFLNVARLAYLHEGLEPKVVHRDVKSSNILLDRKWNAKVSDFGLAKLLGSEKSYVTTSNGHIWVCLPDYASTGMLNEGNDMNLVDWFKGMVASRRGEEVVDPLMEIPPPTRGLKRILLLCLRCIDLDANKRPKMGQIVHMLEADEFPYRVEPRSVRDTAPLHPQALGNNEMQSSQKKEVDDNEGLRWR
ncbi:hypothetical protein DH2020_045306 [Rehmannia glutinosa]|uniref:non-specific serine/threonine protein kinase n=1 Tax=Rehmannia glutinosa TaxID=99300 RepID=A0ABR0UF76_REHGL